MSNRVVLWPTRTGTQRIALDALSIVNCQFSITNLLKKWGHFHVFGINK